MKQFNDIYVGLAVHKDTIAVAIARGLRTKPHYFVEIPNTPAAITELLHQLSSDGEVLNLCCEAGPCGYEIYNKLTNMGQSSNVVVPWLIPRMPGVRIKTDRRDSTSLPKLHADGSLTVGGCPTKSWWRRPGTPGSRRARVAR